MSPSAILYQPTDPNRIFALLPDISDEDKHLIKKACAFAEKAHEGQLRKSGELCMMYLKILRLLLYK